jgi:alpha-D-ribose 1-methylphosphonate 5-triphosphate synthase subunit PhnL
MGVGVEVDWRTGKAEDVADEDAGKVLVRHCHTSVHVLTRNTWNISKIRQTHEG